MFLCGPGAPGGEDGEFLKIHIFGEGNMQGIFVSVVLSVLPIFVSRLEIPFCTQDPTASKSKESVSESLGK